MESTVQPTRELADGITMPVLGLGVWQMAQGRETAPVCGAKACLSRRS